MAKHERDFAAAGEAQLTPREAQSLRRGKEDEAEPAERAYALACFLSAAEGWNEAARRLDGAFAECPAVKAEKD